MNARALILLIWLTTRAKLRRSVRGARTVRGAIFLGLGGLVLLLWLTPSVLSAHLVPRTDPDKTQTVLPLLLLAMCVSNLVTSAGERAVAFSPAEVDLLFPGPFTRRQLLLYKLARSALAAVTASLLFSILFLRFASFWLAGFVGMFLSLLLLQLLGMSVVLIGQSIGEQAYTRLRKVALMAAAVALVATAVPMLYQEHHSMFGVAQQLREAPAGRIVLAPFTVFSRVVTAQSLWPEMIAWGGASIGILGLLLTLVLWLDAHYMEVSAAAGQRLYDRIEHARRTGAPHLRTTAGSARLRVPMLPRLGGAGPIAWRQLTAALRQSRSLLILLLLLSLAAGPAMYLAGLEMTSSAALIGIAFWSTILLSNTLRFDFRGDVDHLDVLKSLPISAKAVVLAELVAPVTVLTVLQLALLAGVRLIFELPAMYLVVAALLALPFNALLFSIENLIFLLFPGRFATGPGDLQGFGRQMVVFLLKMLALLGAVLLAGAAGAVVYALSESAAATLASVMLALWLEAAALLPAIAAAFLRYDVSTDTPAG